MVYDNHILVHGDGTAVYFSNADTAYIFVVVDGTDQYLGRCFRITFRSRNIIQNGIEQRSHVFALFVRIQGSVAALCGSIDKRAVQLLISSVQIHQKLQNLVYDFFRSCFRTVDFVDADDYRKIQLQRFLQNEFGLGHGTFESIYHKDNTVYHLKDTFYLAAEVCMSGSINNIDFYIFIKNSCIFGKNGNTTFSFDVIGIHDTFCHFLIGTEHTALFQKLIDQGGFAVVYMSNDCYISYIFTFHNLILFFVTLKISYKFNSVSYFARNTSFFRVRGIFFCIFGIFGRRTEYILQIKYKKRHFVKKKGEQNDVR